MCSNMLYTMSCKPRLYSMEPRRMHFVGVRNLLLHNEIKSAEIYNMWSILIELAYSTTRREMIKDMVIVIISKFNEKSYVIDESKEYDRFARNIHFKVVFLWGTSVNFAVSFYKNINGNLFFKKKGNYFR